MRRTTGDMGGGCSSPADSRPPTADSSRCASPGTAAVSIRASTTPTSTVLPTSTRISDTRPDAGDGTSVSTLSVEISTTVSSASIQSPTRFFHSTTVPSATDTPICGMVTSATSVSEELTAGLLHVVDLGQHRALERRAERHRRVRRGDADDGTVEVLERLLGDQGRHLGADPARARGLVQHHDLAGLAYRREDRVHVEWYERAQVEDLRRRAVEILHGLERGEHHRAVGDHGQVGALASHPRGAERHLEAALGHLALGAAVEVLVLEVEHRVRVADGRCEEALGVLRRRWRHDLQPG